MARRDSVTVSIAEELRGMESFTDPANRVFRSTSWGRISEYPGSSSTSSKVSDSETNLFSNFNIMSNPVYQRGNAGLAQHRQQNGISTPLCKNTLFTFQGCVSSFQGRESG